MRVTSLDYLSAIPVVCEKRTPPGKNILVKTSFQSTKSGGGEQFLPLDCRATARAKETFLFTDTGTITHRDFC